jgi:cation diffusion facilitator family transporter
MTRARIESSRYLHEFHIDKTAVERRTLIVVVITFVMMIAEIVFGWLTHSMALLADGWHMGTHAFALGLSLLAYIFARTHAQDHRFTFGTWKIEILGAYSSAVALGLVGLVMAVTSVERFFNPATIRFGQALPVAGLGLIVNLVCAAVLHSGKGEPAGADSSPQSHGSDDLNFKSAYLHVVADALTSVLAIAALLGARYFKWTFLDPLMGIVGAALIISWAFSLLKETSGILIDRGLRTDAPLIREIQTRLEADGKTNVDDLHLWRVAEDKYACLVSLESECCDSVEEYKKRLADHPELVHVTIETNAPGKKESG